MEASAFQRPASAQRLRLPRLQRSDSSLAVRVRAGDERAFEELYDRHAGPLLAFCRHLLGSREESEDALQHTFLSAHRALERDDAPDHVKAWLYTIARNRCLSVLRARRDEVALDADGAHVPSTRGLASEVEERADLRELVGDLSRLPDEQRAALVLFELGDHSQDDIAEILGVRRDKVKALVFQAREGLIGWRAARETPCADVREQLSTLRGSALRRAPLRRHVELCQGCQEFDAQVRRQRACLAVVLPVAPAAGLKSAVMSSALGGGTAAATATTATTAGTGALGAAAVAKGVAAKALVAIAVAGGAGGAGYVAVEHAARAPAPATGPVAAPAKSSPRATATRQSSNASPAGVAARAATPAATRSHGRQGAAQGNGHKQRSAATAPTRTRAHGTAGAPGQAKTKTKTKVQRPTKTRPAPTTKPQRAAKPARKLTTKTPQSAKAQRTTTLPRITPKAAPTPVPKVKKPRTTATVVPETPAVTATPVVPETAPPATPGGNGAKKQP